MAPLSCCNAGVPVNHGLSRTRAGFVFWPDGAGSPRTWAGIPRCNAVTWVGNGQARKKSLRTVGTPSQCFPSHAISAGKVAQGRSDPILGLIQAGPVRRCRKRPSLGGKRP